METSSSDCVLWYKYINTVHVIWLYVGQVTYHTVCRCFSYANCTVLSSNIAIQWKWTALVWAAARGSTQLVKVLVQGGADIDIKYEVHTLIRCVMALC